MQSFTMTPKEQLTQIWNRFDGKQRWTLAALAAVTVGMLIFVGVRSAQPEWVLLYGGLEADTASQIVERLRAEKIPYKLDRQGTAVMVEKPRLYELRLQLASMGLPANSGMGFELFDRSSLPGTEFANQINLQRALQGELSRSVNCIDEVLSSRVHLVLPEESLYGKDTEASSSVVLTLKPGQKLNSGQVQGIVNLIASAVRGLEPEAVTVLDSAGTVLSSGVDDIASTIGMSSSQLDIKRQFEEDLRLHLQSMLDSAIGQNKAIVRVQADLNFDTEQVQSEIYSEPDGANGGLKSDHIVEETYDGPRRASGIAGGISANIGAGAGEAAAATGGKYMSRDQNREYELSREVTERTKAAGDLKRLCIAAIVDEELDMASVQKVRDVLEAASGYNEMRGDLLSIQSLPIAARKVAEASQKEAEEAAMAEKRGDQIAMFTRYGSGVAVFLMLAAIIMVSMRQMRRALTEMPESTGAQAGVVDLNIPELPALPAEAAEVQDVVEIADADSSKRLPPEGPSSPEELAEMLQALATESPEVIARQLQRWLTGG